MAYNEKCNNCGSNDKRIAKNSFLEKLLAKISKYLKLGNLKIYLKFGDMQRLYSTK